MLVPPGAVHREAAEDEHGDEGEDLDAVRAAVPVGGEVGDGEQRRAVEDDAGAHAPLPDLLAALAPHEVDEERDREEERDPGDDEQRDERHLEPQEDDRERDQPR